MDSILTFDKRMRHTHEILSAGVVQFLFSNKALSSWYCFGAFSLRLITDET